MCDNDTNVVCVFLIKTNGLITGLEEAACSCVGQDVSLKLKSRVENDSITKENVVKV
jgi:hypothetical protein